MRSLTAPPWRLEKVFISIGARFGYVLHIVSREAELPQQAASAWQNEPLAQLGIFALVGLLSSISHWIVCYNSL